MALHIYYLLSISDYFYPTFHHLLPIFDGFRMLVLFTNVYFYPILDYFHPTHKCFYHTTFPKILPEFAFFFTIFDHFFAISIQHFTVFFPSRRFHQSKFFHISIKWTWPYEIGQCTWNYKLISARKWYFPLKLRSCNHLHNQILRFELFLIWSILTLK
jgi:hypothetical protein